MQSLSYRTLCVIQLRHNYFLNRGEELFEEMEAEEQEKQLRDFDWKESLRILPLGQTERILKNHQLLLRNSADSLRVVVRMRDAESQEPFIPISQHTVLLFGITYQNPYFEHYTDMEFLGEEKVFLANNAPNISGFDAFQPMPVQEGVFFNPQFTIEGSQFNELLTHYTILEGARLKGILALYMSGQSGEYNILNGNGTVKQNPTTFYLTFDNRKTIWKYIQPSLNFTAETVNPKPLTKSGFVTVNPASDFSDTIEFPPAFQFPNPSIHSLKREEDKIISEIHL
nr:hypothetical protein [Cytophagales bacterium]